MLHDLLSDSGRCSGKHPFRVEVPKDHEVRGPRANLTVWHTYEGHYPDGCRSTDTHKYVLTVDGVHFSPPAYQSDGPPTRNLRVLTEIAVTMNERETRD